MRNVGANKSKTQRWIREHVTKYEKCGFTKVAQKLGCKAEPDEIYSSLVKLYDDDKIARKMFDEICHNEEEIHKEIDRKVAKMFRDIQKTETETETVSELGLLEAKLAQLKSECESYDQKLAENEEKRNKAEDVIFENNRLIRELEQRLEEMKAENKVMEVNISKMDKETAEYQDKLKKTEAEMECVLEQIRESQALHFTIEPECVSKTCILAERTSPTEVVQELFTLMSGDDFSSEFITLREAATLVELRKIAEIRVFISKQTKDKKQYWHFANKCNVSELLEILGINIVY